MRILQVVADGAPGGGTNHVIQVLKGMKSPIECGLVTQQDSYLLGQATEMQVPVFSGHFFRSRFDKKAADTIRESIEAFDPDLIHCHGGRAAFFRSFIKRRIPTVYTVHGFHYAMKKKLMQKVVGWAGEYWTIRNMSKVLFVCDHDRQLANRSFLMPHDKNFKVIFNGIRALKPRPKTRELGIGFVGRFVYQKNPQLFLEMLQRLDGVKAVMVGGGELDAEIRSEVRKKGLEDRVQLLGSLDHDATLDVLSQLDALVMTPRWEGLPLLPLEAMFMNVPVVSTAVGGVPEVITHGKTGLLSKSASATELAIFVRQLLSDDSLRQTIVKNANQHAHEKFSQEAMLNQIKTCYDELLLPSPAV